MEERKKFRLADVVLSVICVVFVAEAAAPVASIGNSQYFWWVFMMIAFLLPYGMISSELGTTYTGDGGLYDWINKASRARSGVRAPRGTTGSTSRCGWPRSPSCARSC